MNYLINGLGKTRIYQVTDPTVNLDTVKINLDSVKMPMLKSSQMLKASQVSKTS
jgi:hypothetical protein